MVSNVKWLLALTLVSCSEGVPFKEPPLDNCSWVNEHYMVCGPNEKLKEKYE